MCTMHKKEDEQNVMKYFIDFVIIQSDKQLFENLL